MADITSEVETPEWALSASRVAHIWTEHRPNRGIFAGRLRGWKTPCGASSQIEADWSMPIDEPDSREGVLALFRAKVCERCDRAALAWLIERYEIG